MGSTSMVIRRYRAASAAGACPFLPTAAAADLTRTPVPCTCLGVSLGVNGEHLDGARGRRRRPVEAVQEVAVGGDVEILGDPDAGVT